MLDRIKKTVKQTAIYSLGSLSTKLVGLILLPLYTSHLTTSEYGVLSIVEITSQLLIGLFTLDLPGAMMRWVASEKEKRNEKRIIFTTLASMIIIAVLLFTTLYPFTLELSNLIFGSTKFEYYLTLLLVWSALGIIFRVPVSIIRIQEKSLFFVVVTVSKFTLILAANIYFIAVLKMGVEGIIYSQIIGETFSILITTPLMLRNITPSIDGKALGEMIKYGLPLALSAVSSLILSFGDRYILNYYLSLSGVGLYSLGYKISSVINVFLIHSFQLGFIPIAFKLFDKDQSQRFFSKVLTYFAFILSLSVLFISFFGKEIVYLFAEHSYYQAYKVIPLIAFAFLIKGINIVFTLGYHYSKRTTTYAFIIIFGMLLNIGLNILFIPLFDIYGAGIAMLTSYTFMAVTSYFFSQRLFRIKFEIPKVFMMLGLTVVLYVVTLYLPDTDNFIEVLLKLVLLISFPVILYFMNFYEEIELLRLKQSWHKWKNPRKWRDHFNKIKFK